MKKSQKRLININSRIETAKQEYIQWKRRQRINRLHRMESEAKQ